MTQWTTKMNKPTTTIITQTAYKNTAQGNQ